MPDRGDTPWIRGQLLAGEYRIEGRLGQGALGAVYRVRNQVTDRCYAVKTVRADGVRRHEQLREFLIELEAWIDLPPHPHLTRCLFFRTIGGQVAVFTEFMPGGSLRDQIGRGELASIGPVLDVAIQLAWGIDALHALGAVHRDVKPGNVLLGEGRRVKLSDYSLLRARRRMRQAESPGEGRAADAQLTLPYCSPEQAMGRDVGPATDTWSWAVTVLEMFTGRLTWQIGPAAPAVLERWVAAGGRGGVEMPPPVAAVLRRALQTDPADRWPRIADAATALARVVEQESGQPYPRSRPARPRRREVAAAYRSSILGSDWPDPRIWLTYACQVCGRDPGAVEHLLGPGASSRASQAVAELAAYDEARSMLEDRVAGHGEDAVAISLARLCHHQALIHASAGDGDGALERLGQAAGLLASLVGLPHAAMVDLANVQLARAQVLEMGGDRAAASELVSEGVDLLEALSGGDSQPLLQRELALACCAAGRLAAEGGDRGLAVQRYERAIELLGEPRNGSGAPRHVGDLAYALVLHGNALWTEAPDRALSSYERAEAHYETAIGRGDRSSAPYLANLCQNRAQLLLATGQPGTADAEVARAIEIYEQVEGTDGRSPWSAHLTRARCTRMEALQRLGRSHEALDAGARAVREMEILLERGEGRVAPQLVVAMVNRSNLLIEVGRVGEAGEATDRALELIRRLEAAGEAEGLWRARAVAHLNRGIAEKDGGDPRAALEHTDRSLSILAGRGDEVGPLDPDRVNGRMNRAMALIALGEVEAGLTAFDGLLDGFSVPVPGQVEPLARCLVNASGVVCANGDPGRGLALADRAIGLLDEQRSPHPTAVELLGCALLNRGSSLDALGQHETALVATDRALAQYTRLVDELGYPGFRGRVGHCMANRADLLGSLGRSEAALAEARRAVAVLEAEVEGTDGEALAPVLDYARGLVEREDR